MDKRLSKRELAVAQCLVGADRLLLRAESEPSHPSVVLRARAARVEIGAAFRVLTGRSIEDVKPEELGIENADGERRN